jgi:hypothetical protein
VESKGTLPQPWGGFAPKVWTETATGRGAGQKFSSPVPSKPQNSYTPAPGTPSKGVHPTWGKLQRQKKVGARGPKVIHSLCVGPSLDGPFRAVTSEGDTVKQCLRRWPGLDFFSHGAGSSCLVTY